jgi:biopolymer transport protein ExbB
MDMTTASFAADARDLYKLIGPVGYILILLSIIAAVIILAKLVTFSRAGLGRTATANEFLRLMAERNANAVRVLEASSAPMSRILLLGAQLAAQDAPLARIEADVRDAATTYLLRLSRFNRTLEVIGLVAPLLGLLGTILGMIQAFKVLQDAGAQGDPALLAGGIWEALLTTALGLAVAIPAIVAFNLIENRIDNFRQQASVILSRFLASVEASRRLS